GVYEVDALAGELRHHVDRVADDAEVVARLHAGGHLLLRVGRGGLFGPEIVPVVVRRPVADAQARLHVFPAAAGRGPGPARPRRGAAGRLGNGPFGLRQVEWLFTHSRQYPVRDYRFRVTVREYGWSGTHPGLRW